ncbi:carbohydrate-responsive element-binding protein-like isoform X2 [Ruditapes philippinarum]|uniref:carbohydrate-responsive element-binding protein-like isoform X2 n=1 Tax=Ruditapes philippinarum TaxID=129788 RepID=UPI00295A5884|nr:carbohydrate-responsive element-binding protein-like isoform X2 [Ruditapes philippinarum]
MFGANISLYPNSGNMKTQMQDPVSVAMLHSRDRAQSKEKEGIHSGHFMLSRVHDNKTGDYLSDEEDADSADGFNFSKASKDTCTTYKFGPRSTQTLTLDASLSSLFEHLTLAYNGKLTSPKWKQFRGMHMNVKDKIRVNNIIWREWHMQYIFGRITKVCQFATPLQDPTGHSKPEAVVLEGYYWKRRLDTIAKEYKMWRKFFTQKRFKPSSELGGAETNDFSLLERVGEVYSLSGIPKQQQTSNTDLLLNTRDLQEMMDLSDSLFSTLKQPFDFPNPRELSGFGYGDYIQPGLLQFQPNLQPGLQPNLEDFMDLDPIAEFLSSSKPSSSSQSAMQIGQSLRVSSMDVDMGSTSMVPSPQLAMSPQTPPTPSNSGLFDSPVATPTPSPVGDTAQQMMVDTDNFILNQLQLIQQQNQQKQQLQEQQKQQQQQLEQQKQQLQLQKQQQLEQKRQQQQQQQMQAIQQEQQQQKQQQEQILQLLQNTQLKNVILNSSNATNIIEELLKGLQNQQQTLQQTQNQLQVQTMLQTQQSQLASQSQLQSQLSHTQTQNTPATTDNSLLLGLINANSPNSGSGGASNSQKIPQNNSKPKQRGKIGTTSILEALSVDENQSTRNKVNVSQKTQTPIQKRADMSGGADQQGRVLKDQAGFIIPNAPLKVRGKQRPLAPTPTTTQSSISQQNSYLAQLLTTGTYPGAIISVKEEGGRGTVLSQLQAPTSVQTLQTSQPSTMTLPVSIADFPTSVLIAAASHAFSPSNISVKEVFNTVSRQVTTSSNTSSVVMSPVKQDITSPPATPVYSPVTSPNSSTTSLSAFDDSLLTLKSPETNNFNEESRTTVHTSSEKKRRGNIKSGFDLLHSLIPSLRQNPNAKVSKAAMLQKTAEYCKKLKSERAQMQNEADILKQEINSLNQAIGVCQSQLPATGVPVTRQRADQMREMFEEYVKQRTLTNWKFWIFSLVIRNLFESYNTMVSTASVDELCRTVLAWLDQHCSLPSLRPIVSDSMRHLSTTTSILSDPARVPEQAAQAVIKRQKHQSGDT